MCIIRKPAPFRHFFYHRPLSYARNQRSMDNFFIENSTFTSDSNETDPSVCEAARRKYAKDNPVIDDVWYFWNISVLILKKSHTITQAWGRNLKSSVISQVASCHSARCWSHPRRRIGNRSALEKAARDENEDHEPEHEKIRSFDTNLSIKTNNRAVRQMPRRQFPSRLHNLSWMDWCKQFIGITFPRRRWLSVPRRNGLGACRTSVGKIKEQTAP